MKRVLIAMLLLCALAPSLAEPQEAGFRPFIRGSWQQILHAHAGQPLIVHFWGLTCGPCRTEMPLWGRFFAKRRALALLMVNADLVPNEQGAAFALLAQAGLADAENWMFDPAIVERLRYEIAPRWQGEIPRTLLIGRDGKVTTIDGSADFKAVGSWLDSQAGSGP